MFGILELAGRVYTVAAPDGKKETPMAEIEATTVKGSAFHTDVQWHGKHVPIDHQRRSGCRPHQRDRRVLELRRATVPARLRGRPGNFPLYLAEYEFRYNHRAEHLPTLLYNRLIRATVPTRTQPQNFATHLTLWSPNLV